MSNPRGDTQARILAYIEKATLQKGYPPSVREICDATGLKSTSTVHGHLIRLEKKGLLYRDSMKPRAISVPADHQMYRTEMVNVPILGPCDGRRTHSCNRKYRRLCMPAPDHAGGRVSITSCPSGAKA